MVHPVHHATLAKANKLGFTVTGSHEDEVYTILWAERNKRFTSRSATQGVDDMRVFRMLTLEYPKLTIKRPNLDAWDIFKGKTHVGHGDTLQAAWDDAFEELTGGEPLEEGEELDLDDVEDDEEEGEEGGKSIVKKKFKSKYKPFKATNGDDLAQLLAKHLKVKDEIAGKMKIDEDKLERFAKRNGIWSDDYDRLNIGQRRMNIGNRLRAKLRQNPDYAIIWN